MTEKIFYENISRQFEAKCCLFGKAATQNLSVAKRVNVPPTIDTPKNCLPFYKNQTPLHKLIIASYCAVPRYPLFATLSLMLNVNVWFCFSKDPQSRS